MIYFNSQSCGCPTFLKLGRIPTCGVVVPKFSLKSSGNLGALASPEVQSWIHGPHLELAARWSIGCVKVLASTAIKGIKGPQAWNESVLFRTISLPSWDSPWLTQTDAFECQKMPARTREAVSAGAGLRRAILLAKAAFISSQKLSI